jgi:hypothetical protein
MLHAGARSSSVAERLSQHLCHAINEMRGQVDHFPRFGGARDRVPTNAVIGDSFVASARSLKRYRHAGGVRKLAGIRDAPFGRSSA